MGKGRKNGNRVAIVAGLRTPFAKSGTAYKDVTALELAKIVVTEMVERSGIKPKDIQQVVYGQVAPSVQMPNIAREIVLGTGLPQTIDAYSVSRACTTSYQAAVNITEAILTGAIDCGIAGGADSASDVPITVSRKLSNALVTASRARSLGERLSAFKHLSPKDLVPVPPAIAEATTGETMGESAEKMAKENGISRQAQDEYAHRSHVNAAKGWEDGRLRDEVMTVLMPPKFRTSISEDNLVRKDSQLEGYAKLKPAFDRRHGTITAANASPLTDGASALLLMSEEKARALGMDILGFVKSYAFAAVDPREQLLMGPVYAAPMALEKAGLELSDFDLIDMHEAFAAQVLSNIQGFESNKFAKEKLGRDKRIGKIDWDKLNVLGGSIALGHPFAATGARQITQTLRELQRRKGEFALCTACAAGGLGVAMVLEAA